MLGFGVVLKSLSLWLIIFPLSPILLSFLLLLFLYRQLIIKLSGIFRPDLQSPLEGLDVSFALDDFWTRPKGATSFIWILKGQTDSELILKRFQIAISNSTKYDYTKLTSVFPEFWMGYPFWKKSGVAFRMKNHLRILSPPNPSGTFQSSVDLNQFLCSWMRSGFKKRLPLWEVMVIPKFRVQAENRVTNYTSRPQISKCVEKSVVALKIHHVIGDGYSKLRLLEKILDPRDPMSPTDDCSGSPKQQERPKRLMKTSLIPEESGGLSRIRDSVLNFLLAPLTLYKLLKDFVIHEDYFTGMKADSEVWMSTTNLRMETFKDLRGRFRLKFGQRVPLIVVAASVFAGALRRFLGTSMEDVEVEGIWKSAGRGINFVMALPLGDKHPGDYQFCNHWTHGIFNVDMAEVNPVQRLLKLHQNFQETLAIRWPIVYHSTLPFQALLPKFVWKWITNFNMGASIGSTNMIGPNYKVFVGGREVLEKYAYVGLLWKHSSMTAAFFSYNGIISATLVANRNVIPDPEIADEIMSQFLHQELHDLMNWFD